MKWSRQQVSSATWFIFHVKNNHQLDLLHKHQHLFLITLRMTKHWEKVGENLLFGGRMILVGTEENPTAKGETEWVKQEGQPLNNLGPHISPSAINWTTQFHINIVITALIIQSFIRDLETIELFKFSTLLSPKSFIFISQNLLQ